MTTIVVVIEVRGGVVQEVHVPPDTHYVVVDWDDLSASEAELDDLEALLEDVDAFEAAYPGESIANLSYEMRLRRTDLEP